MPVPDYILPDRIFDLEGAKEFAKDIYTRWGANVAWAPLWDICEFVLHYR
jgi:hypothetical protein